MDAVSHLNLVLAWLWILLGFASGLVLGLGFQREDWLGGYTALKRRLYRLGHIAFFGLGAVNLMFYLTVRAMPDAPGNPVAAAWLFAVGAVTMPICCIVLAHWPKAHLCFAIPVLSLLAGGGLTLWIVIKNYWRNL